MRRVLLLLLLPLLLVGPSLLPGQRFLPQAPVGFEPLASEQPAAAERAWEDANWITSDRLFPVLSDELAMRARLGRGEWPAWEPKFGMGAPLFAGSIAALAYPPNALRYLLPPDLAGGWCALLALFLAGLGMWLFLERRELTLGACAIGALAYQGGGFAVSNLHYAMKVDAALWLPWALLAVEGVLSARRRSGLALTIAIACSLLAGFPQIGAFTVYATAAYAVWRAIESGTGPARAGRALLFVLLGVGASGVYLLPMAEVSAHSMRQPQTVEAMSAQAMPASALVTLVDRTAFGSPTAAPGADEEFAHANALEWNLHVGLVVLALALAGLGRRGAFPLAVALVSLGYAQAWPGVRWLYALPGLDLGAPSRASALWWTMLPWLAALGADRASRLWPALWSPRGLGLAAGLILAEAFVGGRAGLAPRDLAGEPLFPKSAAIEAVREAAGDGRVLRFDASDSGLDDVLVLARPNLLHAYGIADLTPYVVFTNRRLVELFAALDPRTRYRTGISRLPAPELLGHPVLDLVRVTCVLARRPLDHPRLELRHAGPEFFVYHRTGSLPAVRGVPRAATSQADETAVGLLVSGALDLRTTTVLAPGNAAAPLPADCDEPYLHVLEQSRPNPDRLDLVVESNCGGWVVMSEAWMPGWKATVNGEDAEVLRADHVGRALRVGPGRSVVRTKYEPWSQRLGLGLTLVCLLAAIVLARRDS